MCLGVRKWTMRSQILFSFLGLTIIVEIIIFSIIYVSLTFISSNTSKEIGLLVHQITEDNMHGIGKEKGAKVVNDKDLIGGSLFIMNYLLQEILVFGSLSESQYLPSLTYDEAIRKNEELEISLENYGKDPYTKKYSNIWFPENYVQTEEGDQFIKATAQLDRFLQIFYRLNSFKDNIQRFNIYYIKNNTSILRVWPAQKILNPKLKLTGNNTLNESYYLYAQYTLKNAFDLSNPPHPKNYQFTILNGPYNDMKTFGYPVISFNTMLFMNKAFSGVIQLEYRQKFFIQYTEGLNLYIFNYILIGLNFLTSGYGILIQLFGRMIGLPKTWIDINEHNSTILIHEIPNRTDFSWSRYWDLYARQNNTKTLNEISIMDSYFNKNKFYESIVLLPYEINQTTFKRWEFAIVLHVLKEEIDSIKTNVFRLMERHTTLIMVLGFFICSFTMSCVLVLCYKVCMSISKPLKIMINAANIINNNATDKNLIMNIEEELNEIPKGEYQLKTLIKSFKEFVGFMNSNRVKAAKIIKKPCFYPLNQFNKDFVEHAKKGNSEIDWREIIERFENEIEDDREIDEIDMI